MMHINIHKKIKLYLRILKSHLEKQCSILVRKKQKINQIIWNFNPISSSLINKIMSSKKYNWNLLSCPEWIVMNRKKNKSHLINDLLDLFLQLNNI